MIETETTTTITCDRCGRVIAEGETWYQVQQSAASAVFAGTASDLTTISAVAMQLCEDDYTKSGQQLAELAPRLVAPATLTGAAAPAG